MIDPLLQTHADLLARVRVALQNTPSLETVSGKALLAEIAVAERCLVTGALPWPITIHVGVVEHRHGMTIYTTFDSSTLTREIAEFCREYWSELQGRMTRRCLMMRLQSRPILISILRMP
jgi:hypothetical protein